jgi:anti-sigma B factor antagonist
VTGELDMSTAGLLGKAVEDACSCDAGGRLILDMSGVGFCDSAGISALVQSRKLADQAHLQLEVHRPALAVRRVLELSGLTEYLNVR